MTPAVISRLHARRWPRKVADGLGSAPDREVVGGWEAVGEQVAGTRDVVTGKRALAAPTPGVAAPLRQLTGLAFAVAAIAALYFGQGVLVPVTLAVILSFILSPLVNMLQRLRLWRAPAVILTVVAALSLLAGIGTLLGTQAAALSVNAPQYASAIQSKVTAMQGLISSRVDSVTKALGGGRRPPRGPAVQDPATVARASGADQVAEPKRPLLVEVAPPKTSPLSVAQTILQPIIGPLETTFIVLMVAVFVLMQKEDLRDRFIRVFGSGDLHRTTMALDDAGRRLSRYFVAQLAINTTFGVVIGFALWMFGLPSPVMWGVLAGLLRFVPYIGPVLAAVVPVALGAAIDPGWSTAIFIAITFIVVESIIGYIVEPLLYGHSTGLSPVSVIVSAIFWTFLWGPVGLVLSTPLTLCLVVLGRHVKALEFFDVILGDRPALTAVETLYQRLLAGNTDDALSQAETMLGERPLHSYHDTVVLPALCLAAVDNAKGILDDARIDVITSTVIALVADLDSTAVAHDETKETVPAEEIMCVAGRGPFDEAVAKMLQQLLEHRRYRPRFVAHHAVARGAIANLDLSAVNVIAICCLDLSGAPAHLRFLVRRLRHQAPNARIILGLWPDGEAALSDAAVQTALGANRYVGSLTAAVEAIIDGGEELIRSPTVKQVHINSAGLV